MPQNYFLEGSLQDRIKTQRALRNTEKSSGGIRLGSGCSGPPLGQLEGSAFCCPHHPSGAPHRFHSPNTENFKSSLTLALVHFQLPKHGASGYPGGHLPPQRRLLGGALGGRRPRNTEASSG